MDKKDWAKEEGLTRKNEALAPSDFDKQKREPPDFGKWKKEQHQNGAVDHWRNLKGRAKNSHQLLKDAKDDDVFVTNCEKTLKSWCGALTHREKQSLKISHNKANHPEKFEKDVSDFHVVVENKNDAWALRPCEILDDSELFGCAGDHGRKHGCLEGENFTSCYQSERNCQSLDCCSCLLFNQWWTCESHNGKRG